MLTTKKKKFAEAIFQGKNQREAAIYAGYSEKSAISKGSHLTKDPDVINYIKMLTFGVNVDQQFGGNDALEENKNDPLKVMEFIMISHIDTDPKLSLDAAAKLAPYVHRKLEDQGKKKLKEEKAKAVNRFAALPTPTLKH